MKIIILVGIIVATLYDISKNNGCKYLIYLHIYLIMVPYVRYSIPYFPLPLFWLTGTIIGVVLKKKFNKIEKKGIMISGIYGFYAAYTCGNFSSIVSQLSIPIIFITGIFIAASTHKFKYLATAVLVGNLPIVMQNLWRFIPAMVILRVDNLKELLVSHYQLGIAAASLGILSAALIGSKKILHNVLGYFGLAISFLVTFLSGARAQTAGLIIATVYILPKKKFIIIIVISIFSVIISQLVDFSDFIEDDFATSRYLRIGSVSDFEESSEYTFRQDQREWGIQRILENPIFGYGFGSWFEENSAFSRGTNLGALGPHNGYILILYQYGLIGFSLFAYSIFMTFVGLRTLKNDSLSLIPAMIVLLYLIIGFAHSVLASYNGLWLYLGASIIHKKNCSFSNVDLKDV